MTSLIFRLKKNIDETRNYLLDEIKHNDLMSEKHKKVCRDFNYLEHFFLFISIVTKCLSVSSFASLVSISVGIASPAVGLKYVQSLDELKNIRQLSKKKRRRSMLLHMLFLINMQ